MKERRNAVTTESPPLPQEDAAARSQRDLVRRVLASPAFARSERLSALLSFVCEMTLAGRGTELNEQCIGQAVFGRSPEYDSSADGIVRTQASRLRQRLEVFFEQGEGRDEPLRVVIPKGRYVPLFQPRLAVAQLPKAVDLEPSHLPEPALPAAINEVAASPRTRFAWLPWLLCTLLACALALVLRHQQRPRAVNVHPLWGQMFLPGRSTLEVPGDSGLVLSYALDRHDVNLHDYLSGDYRNHPDSSGPALTPQLAALKADFIKRPYTSIVDLEAAVKLGQLAQQANASMQIRYARDLRPNDLKDASVILIGALEANPWVELYEHNMNFALRDQNHVFSVLNKAPRAGEPGRWTSRVDDPDHRVYGVVAFLPNLSGEGNALLVEGTSMAGTEAAWDFVSDDVELLPFLQRIRRRNGAVPHFEVVVSTQNMNTRAVRDDLITWRVLD